MDWVQGSFGGKEFKMKIETKSVHVTPVGDNLFADLGFGPGQSAALKADSQRIISEKLIIKNSLMGELAKWIDENQLKQVEAAQILGVSRPRVSDVVNGKSTKFTIDSLVDMLARTGKNIVLSIR
ncbi:Xre family transcriptional regulator [Limnobacter thiooxidans]|nr:Xre family transcriptional regulator [Limnobacter thiooxidans]